MNLTLHIIKKDARRLAWPLALWLALLAAEPLFGLWLAHGTGWVWGEFDGIVIYHRLLVGLQIAACLVLTARLVQDDSLVDNRAFWPTRPISRACLLRAKLAALVGFFWLPPLLILLPWWLSSGLGFGEIANVALETVLRQAAITLPALVLASITAEIGSFIVWAAALVVAMMAGYLWWLGGSGAGESSEAEVNAVRCVLAILGALWLAAGLSHFLTGLLRRTRILLGLCGAATIVIFGLFPRDVAEIVRPAQPNRRQLVAAPNSPPAVLAPAPAIAGFDLSLGPARVVIRLNGETTVQLQLVLDRAQPSRVALPWTAETIWSWPEDRDHTARRIILDPKGGFESPLIGSPDGPPVEYLIAQSLNRRARFALPLDLVDQRLKSIEEASPSRRDASRAIPWPIKLPDLMAGSRHGVTTKVKLMVWEETSLTEAPLGPDGQGAFGNHRLSVVGWNGAFSASTGSNGVTVTLVGRGPAPSTSLKGALFNAGEWDLPPTMALVNPARTGFLPGRPTRDSDQHLRIGGVGLDFNQTEFLEDEYLPLTELTADSNQLGRTVGQPNSFNRDRGEGATVVSMDFKPLGWFEREATVADITVLGLPVHKWQFDAASELHRRTISPGLAAIYPELAADLGALNTVAAEASADDYRDTTRSIRLTRDYTTILDQIFDRLNALSENKGESAENLEQMWDLKQQLTALRLYQP